MREKQKHIFFKLERKQFAKLENEACYLNPYSYNIMVHKNWVENFFEYFSVELEVTIME